MNIDQAGLMYTSKQSNIPKSTNKQTQVDSSSRNSTPIVELTIAIPPEESLDSLPESYIRDIFSAYGFSLSSLDHEKQICLLNKISNIKKTFPYLREVVSSDRYPRTIMLLSSKIGMYIPPRKRIGLAAYNFYLSNIKYYESILERSFVGSKIPSIHDIFMAKDRVAFLMKYRDDEVLQPGYQFSRNYENRRNMIEKFISDNILIYGEFNLENNSKTSYATRARVITYSDGKITLNYSATELLKLFDLSRGVLWKNIQGFNVPCEALAFHRLALLHLRRQILEKFGQWRHRDNHCQISGSAELYRIFVNLENILNNEVRNDAGAYLGNPRLN